MLHSSSTDRKVATISDREEQFRYSSPMVAEPRRSRSSSSRLLERTL